MIYNKCKKCSHITSDVQQNTNQGANTMIKKNILLVVSLLISICVLTGCSKEAEKETYLGQEVPGLIPEVFAPGIISNTEDMEFGCTITPDLKEIYYSVRLKKTGIPRTMHSRLVDNEWTEPELMEFEGSGNLYEPHMTADGETMYFSGGIYIEDQGSIRGIWKRQLEGDSWSEPTYVNDGMYVKTTTDGSIYMTDITQNRGIIKIPLVNGEFTESEALIGGPNEPVPGVHPCISPDESFLIYNCKRPDGYGSEADLYVSFNNGDGTWSEGYNLGSDINSEGIEFTASLTPDGKYIFFMKDYDLYWVDVKIIEQFRPDTN